MCFNHHIPQEVDGNVPGHGWQNRRFPYSIIAHTSIPIYVTSGFCHTLGDNHSNEKFDTTGSFIAYRITNISHLGCRKTIIKWILTETDCRRCNIISWLWWSQTSWAPFHSLWYSIITIPQKNYSFLTNLSLSVTWYGSHEAQIQRGYSMNDCTQVSLPNNICKSRSDKWHMSYKWATRSEQLKAESSKKSHNFTEFKERPQTEIVQHCFIRGWEAVNNRGQQTQEQ